LKKQSQFVPGLVSATSYLKEDYDKIPCGGDVENKAKQSQSFDFAQDRFTRAGCCVMRSMCGFPPARE
jgi:hypothetical protein